MAARARGDAVLCGCPSAVKSAWKLSVWTGEKYFAEFPILSGKGFISVEKLLWTGRWTAACGGGSLLCLYGGIVWKCMGQLSDRYAAKGYDLFGADGTEDLSMPVCNRDHSHYHVFYGAGI